ncbi:hypothetical protein D3C73_837550 [compost metagenome]
MILVIVVRKNRLPVETLALLMPEGCEVIREQYVIVRMTTVHMLHGKLAAVNHYFFKFVCFNLAAHAASSAPLRLAAHHVPD